jgi:signal transduction histidine kinase
MPVMMEQPVREPLRSHIPANSARKILPLRNPAQPGSVTSALGVLISRRYTTGAAYVCLAGGVLVLLAWISGVHSLTALLPGTSSMKANTAICFILAAVSLWCQSMSRRGAAVGFHLTGIAAACAVGIVSGLTLFQYVAGVDVGIDQVLFPDAFSYLAGEDPGRMSPLLAVVLLLCAGALVAKSVLQGRWWFSDLPALLALSGSCVTLVGYVYGWSDLYRTSVEVNATSFPAAILTLSLSSGIIASNITEGPLASLVSTTMGGVLFRKLIPWMVLIPFTGSGLMIMGEANGLFSLQMGLALLVTVTILLSALILSVIASEVDSSDHRRLLIEGDLWRANIDLTRSSAKLQAANKELEAFSYSVSHDLRAPLRHIVGFGHILADDLGDRLDPEARRYVEKMRSGAEQMGKLIDDLLTFSRLERASLRPTITGLSALVEGVIHDLLPEAEGRIVEWKVAPLPFVECDPALIKQVMVNLLTNALKFTRPRSPAVIEVGQLLVEGRVTVFVRDNGVGFSMKYADKLFGVFQRLHRMEDFEGTGVGLATVQRIVLKHGGSIWAEAELDQGATFFFTLDSTPPADGGQNAPPEVNRE